MILNPQAWDNHTLFVKPRITTGFAALRKLGYLARQNHLCCSSCAATAIAGYVQEMPDSAKAKLKGAVYYHQQDGDVLKHTQMRPLHLRYGQVHVYADDRTVQKYGLAEVVIGEAVVHTLRAHGLRVHWDGDPNQTITVTGLSNEVLDAAAATVRLGGDAEDVLNPARKRT